LTVVTKNPTTNQTIVSGWTNPSNAYTENGVNTYASVNNAEQKYGGWNFTTSDIPEGSTITKVEIGAKHYESPPSGYTDYTCLKYIRTNGSIGNFYLTVRSSLTWDWMDITYLESGWDLTKLNNADFRIKMYESQNDGGCQVETEDEKCYVICLENGKRILKSLSDVKVGDQVLICDYDSVKPLGQSKVTDWMRFSKVLGIDVRNLVQEDVVEIWSGELDLGTHLNLGKSLVWKAHVTVTKVQPFHVFSADSKTRIKLSAEELYNQIKNGADWYIKHLWFGWTVKPFKIEKAALKTVTGKAYKLSFIEKDFGVFSKTLHRNELETLQNIGLNLTRQQDLGPPFMAIGSKTTCYVDVVAIRVTFTPPTEGQAHNIGEGLTNQTIIM
jgi:hypothetical protein